MQSEIMEILNSKIIYASKHKYMSFMYVFMFEGKVECQYDCMSGFGMH